MLSRKFLQSFYSKAFPLKFFSSTGPVPLKAQKQLKEKEISDKLKTELKATFVEVIDTSNSGCKSP